MKFQKGILTGEEQRETAGIKLAKNAVLKPVSGGPAPRPTNAASAPKLADDRLFETQEKVTSSSRHYLVVLGIVVVVVLIGGAALYYLMQPGIGDQITTPKAAEAAVREHFLTNEKRTATDMTFYKCEGYLWARVGVETRNDIPNPLLKVPTFSAKLVPNGENSWEISAKPITSPDLDVPCK